MENFPNKDGINTTHFKQSNNNFQYPKSKTGSVFSSKVSKSKGIEELINVKYYGKIKI